MSTKKIMVVFLCIIMLVSVITACDKSTTESPQDESGEVQETAGVTDEQQSDEQDEGESEKKVLNLAWTGSYEGTNAWSTSINMFEATSLIFDTLLSLDYDLTTVGPRLAETWSISDDGLTYTFNLRNDVMFHNGTMMTAKDVVRSFDAFVGVEQGVNEDFMKIVGAEAFYNGEADTIEGVEAVDDYTVKVTLSEPSSILLSNIAWAVKVYPADLIMQNLDPANFGQDEFWLNPVGTGPFMVSERVAGDYDLLVAFEDYFLGRPKIDEVIIRWRDTQLAAEKGELDFQIVQAADVAQALEENTDLEVYEVDGLTKREIFINHDKEYMQDIRVRQAIAYAIDTETICEEFFEGAYQPWGSLMTPGYWANDSLGPIEYNPEKAEELLAEAGWDSSRELDFIYYYTDDVSKDFVAIVQNYLAEVGIMVTPRLVDTNAAAELYELRTFDIAYGALNRMDPSILNRYISSDAARNVSGFESEELTAMLEEASELLDKEERKEAYDEVQQYLYDNMIDIPLFEGNWYVVKNPNLDTVNPIETRWCPVNFELHLWDFAE